MNPLFRAIFWSVLVFAGAVVYMPLHITLRKLGMFRIFGIQNIHGLEGITKVDGTFQCEDVHFHGPSNTLYLACQDPKTRGIYDWAPQLAIFNKPKAIRQGQIVVVDANTLKAKPLELKGFSGPFSPHGFGIMAPGNDENAVTIVAVNHLPNPDHYEPSPGAQASPLKARSQIEVFFHKVGEPHAQWIRSIRHPLIQTPNDVLPFPPNTFYVTNDHFYREGFMRKIEDVLSNSTGGWTNTVHVTYSASKSGVAPEEGVTAQIALDGQHYSNGIGHSAPSRPWEITLTDASGGAVLRIDKREEPKLSVIESIEVDGTIDNPFWHTDWYSSVEPDGTGYILAGLAKGGRLADDVKDPKNPIPVMVWHVKPRWGPVANGGWGHAGWDKVLIFQDDGHGIKSASAATLVGIDPEKNGGKKEAKLFITGFASDAMVMAKIAF